MATTSEVADMLCMNRTSSGMLMYRNGASVSSAANGGTGVSGSVFSAEKLTVGAIRGTNQAAINVKTIACWTNDNYANAAAITGAL
jgi:hypothetical protein